MYEFAKPWVSEAIAMLAVRPDCAGNIADVKMVMRVAPVAGPLNTEIVETPPEVYPCKNKDVKMKMRSMIVMEMGSLKDNIIWCCVFSFKCTAEVGCVVSRLGMLAKEKARGSWPWPLLRAAVLAIRLDLHSSGACAKRPQPVPTFCFLDVAGVPLRWLWLVRTTVFLCTCLLLLAAGGVCLYLLFFQTSSLTCDNFSVNSAKPLP